MFATQDIFVFMLILTRMVGLFLFAPFFAHTSIPPMAKAGFAMAFALMVFPLVDIQLGLPPTMGELILWMAKELAVGLAMGFAVRMLFFMLDFASHVLTVEIGLTPGAEFDPSTARGGNPMGSIMYFLGLMVLLSGTEYDILRAFLSSYEVAPVAFMHVNEYAGDFIVKQTAGIFKVGVLMAAPVVAVNFLVNLVFAVLGKVVPKLNVFILSFSAKIMAGTTVFAFSIILIVSYVIRYANETAETMMRFIMFRPVF